MVPLACVFDNHHVGIFSFFPVSSQLLFGFFLFPRIVLIESALWPFPITPLNKAETQSSTCDEGDERVFVFCVWFVHTPSFAALRAAVSDSNSCNMKAVTFLLISSAAMSGNAFQVRPATTSPAVTSSRSSSLQQAASKRDADDEGDSRRSFLEKARWGDLHRPSLVRMRLFLCCISGCRLLRMLHRWDSSCWC